MKKDIETRADIIILMDQFYEKIKVNTLLRPIFVDVAQLDFDAHMPILYDFWCTLALCDQRKTADGINHLIQRKLIIIIPKGIRGNIRFLFRKILME